jgi:hypothetical protein
MKSLLLAIQKTWPMLKFLKTDRQTDGQAKNYMPPIFPYGGIKTGSLKKGHNSCPWELQKIVGRPD